MIARALYDDTAFYLQYHVEDEWIRAQTNELTGPVWEDSYINSSTLEPQRYYTC